MGKSTLMAALMVAALNFGGLPVMTGQAETSSISMNKITVTANKMEENIQKVPQDISVINETEIEEMGLQDSMDVLNQIPGMLVTPDNGIGETFRGLKRSRFTGNCVQGSLC